MEDFAKAVLLAAQIREESFDHEKVEKIRKDKSKKFLDYRSCYTKKISEAASEAAEKLGFDETANTPIYLLLTCCWNDSLAWAESIVKGEK